MSNHREVVAMAEIMHFNSFEERIAYLRGKFEEIEPKVAEDSEKPKKAKKGKKKDDKVQAE